MPETITFELIRKIQREEQVEHKLTKLPENFFENVKSYLQQKRKLLEKGDKKIALELKNIERLVEDIFNRRERKIVNQAIVTARTSIPPENLTEEEKEFFENLVNSIKERRKILDSLLAPPKEELVSLVVFKQDVPEFVGSDEKVYGPFKKGDIAKLPEENMKILIEKKIVEEFKVPK